MEIKQEASLADLYLRGLQKRLGSHLRQKGPLGVLINEQYQEMALVWLDTVLARRQLRLGNNEPAITVIRRSIEDDYSLVEKGNTSDDILEDGYHAFRALDTLGQPIEEGIRARFGHMPLVTIE